MATTTTNTKPPATGRKAAARGALDVMLTDAAVDQGGSRRFLQPNVVVKTIGGLARRPGRVAARVGGLGSELARVAAGRSELAPAKSDKRFGDRGWQDDWLLHRLMQAYFALTDTVEGLITDAELDWQAERQARFAAGNVLDALAPTNYPWSNPAVLREIIDTGGANLVRGARLFLRDMSSPPRLPATVDTTKFEVGGNLALTPGSVVLRTDVFELIQYQPQTEKVCEQPLLFVPPTINKYYVLDIAPGRSFVEYLVQQGQQVFMVSWRNPDQAQGHFDFDTYAQAVLEAREAAAKITRQDTVHLGAACSGGIITAGVLGHLAASGRLGDVGSVALLVCALDQARAGTTSALATREVAAMAIAESARKGYLDGRALASVFTWLRPNDLIWGYVVNNYLLGKPPPAFDILFWNQDTVRLAAGLHRDFVQMSVENSITRANEVTVLGTPIDLGAVGLDNYIVAGSTDHIVPWENSYQSSQLLGGPSRFVLSTSGHIQALVNPTTNARASFRVADEHPPDYQAWLDQAATKSGSWWSDYLEWLQSRSGEEKPAPKTLGGAGYKALAKAPGSYVFAK